jgi:hypothetical protein
MVRVLVCGGRAIMKVRLSKQAGVEVFQVLENL